MKFPRNARMLKGHLDFAPFAAVFFCLLIFVLLASLVYTPGVHIQLLPAVPGLTGVEGAPVPVELDREGHIYFQDQMINENDLKLRLERLVKQSSRPLALVLLADGKVTTEQQMRVWKLARDAGISSGVLPTLPEASGAPKGR